MGEDNSGIMVGVQGNSERSGERSREGSMENLSVK